MSHENIDTSSLHLCTTVALAQQISSDTRIIRYRKNRLVAMGHPSFKKYVKGAGLTATQADVIKQWQSLSNQGYRGQSLYKALLSPATFETHIHQLKDFSKTNNLSEAATQQLLTLVEKILAEVRCIC